MSLAQATGGAAAGAAAGGSVGTARGTTTSSGSIAGPTGRVNPGGVSAAQSAIQPGASVNSAGASVTSPGAGQIGTPGTSTPVGTINPGGITAAPLQNVGRTFDRATIGGGPTETIIDPAATQPTFRFPPASTLPQGVVTNSGVGGQFDSGLPASKSVAGNPVGVGNAPVSAGNTVVGGNFGSVRVPSEPVVINLPPGTRIRTNAFGVAELGTPTVGVAVPTIIPTNSVGRGPTFDSSRARSLEGTREPIRPTAPPRSAPIVPNR
ncbi:MAG: hypothetical protein ACXW3Z_15345 [Limisphaerales bacterium]